MKNLNILKEVIKEKIEVSEINGEYYLSKVDNERFANIKISVVDSDDKIFNVQKTLILEYNGKREQKVFHSGDMQFPIMRFVSRLEIESIDKLPTKPIRVLVFSNVRKEEGSEIKYKTSDYIACGVVDKIEEVKIDGIEYLISINSRVKIEG